MVSILVGVPTNPLTCNPLIAPFRLKINLSYMSLSSKPLSCHEKYVFVEIALNQC